MIEVGFAELHNDLFLGKNHGKRLDTNHKPNLKLTYDRKERELIVNWMDKTAFVPSTNVAYYIPGVAEDRKILQQAHPMVAGISVSAQVETPMGHVHAGPGQGKTGKSK